MEADPGGCAPISCITDPRDRRCAMAAPRPPSYDVIRKSVEVCMFDQYGTVVDMQGGLTAVATPFLQKKGWTGNPNSFVTWWRRTHFENSMIDALLQREHTPYREIGHRAVAYVMDRAGITYTGDEVRYLVGEIEKLKPFPEIPPALARLQTKYKLVVLSNGDPDMLEAAKQHHKIPFDRVISVAAANSFKPRVQTHREGAEIANPTPDPIPFLCQPSLPLQRGKVGRHAPGIHRPPQPAFWRHAAPAGHSCPHHEGPGRRDRLKRFLLCRQG